MFESEPVAARIHQAIQIEILGWPPSANARPGNPHERARITAEWRSTSRILANEHLRSWDRRHAQKWEPLKVATMIVTFVLPTKGRHDWDNLVSMLKPLLDGIVDAKVVVDDSIYALPHVYTEFEYRKGVKAIRFEISEPVE
jgi:hypothetical protein